MRWAGGEQTEAASGPRRDGTAPWEATVQRASGEGKGAEALANTRLCAQAGTQLLVTPAAPIWHYNITHHLNTTGTREV